MRRTERLFALAEYLRGRRTGVTAETLAARFDVTVRTIYRDLDALRDASLPLAAERGRGGGYALDSSYSLPPVNFTSREAAVIVALGRFAIEMRLLPFTDTLESGMDKIRGALSRSAQRELLARLKELSFTGVPALPSRKAVREVVERAWFEQSAVRITYVDRSSVETTRVIHIEGVIMDRHETRLDARDVDSGERRPFRLDAVTRAEIVKEPISERRPVVSSRPRAPDGAGPPAR
ncbi:MAG: helix-turn-helix transcriptional regulator [Polyangiaceae bacterium]